MKDLKVRTETIALLEHIEEKLKAIGLAMILYNPNSTGNKSENR
jgi:hypothetical protein